MACKTFPAHQEELTVALGLVESYVESIQGGGVVIGVGIAIYLHHYNIFIEVEDTVNQQIKGAPLGRRIVAYLAGFIIFPLAVLFSSTLNIFISSAPASACPFGCSEPYRHSHTHCLGVALCGTHYPHTTFYLVVPNAKGTLYTR